MSLGIIEEPSPDLVRARAERLAESEQPHGGLLRQAVPAGRAADGLRPVNKGNVAIRPA